MPFAFSSIYFDQPIVGGRVLDIFWPSKPSREISVFIVHGGGWRNGSRGSFHSIMQALNDQGYVCGSTDYRLKDTHIFDQITDVRHGYELFLNELKNKGLPNKVVVFGSSAGAHLGSLLTLSKPGACGEKLEFGNYCLSKEWISPIGGMFQAATATFEPWEDIFPEIWNSMENIVGIPYKTHPELYRQVSPITHISPSSPPLFFLEAQNEHVFLFEKTREMIRQLHAMGRRAEFKFYPHTEHGFFYDIQRRCQKEALSDILKFIESLAGQS